MSTPEHRSYHGQPVIKQPVWTWEIPTYFFTGGIAGASAALGYMAELRGNEPLAHRAWTNAMIGVTISPALLTLDLGRPLRFINMLRMVKVSSPMSLGSWTLVGSGSTTALVFVSRQTGLFVQPARVARPLAAFLGLTLSTYTAALVANTAVPAWHEARRELPFVFASSAALSAGAAAAIWTPPASAAPARRLAVAGAAFELAAKELMNRRLGEHRDAYRHGAAARLDRASQGCIAAGAGLLATRGRRSSLAAGIGGGLLCVGALCARWSVFRAGFQSAADPKYVVGPQRAAVERGERTGAARREARVAAGDNRSGSPVTAQQPEPKSVS